MIQNNAFLVSNISLKEFASFIHLAQVPALDINVLFISADLQICS